MQKAVIDAELCDSGANGMARWARLPVGINGKPKYKTPEGKRFQCRLTEWHPEVRYTVEELVAGLKLSMDAAPAVLSAKQPVVVPKVAAVVNAKKFAPIELPKLASLLATLDPDCGRNEWMNAMRAVHNETGGSDAGLDLFDAWSSKGTKYKGRRDVEVQWHSLDKPSDKPPITIGTLIKMAREAGADVDAILMGDEAFGPCETEVIEPGATTAVTTTDEKVMAKSPPNPLAKFSLLGRTQELEAQMVEQKPLFGNIIVQGQASVIHAPPNTGKTLILLHMITEAIKEGVRTRKLFLVNLDDNSMGLVEKNRLADEYGFNMLADGHQGFKVTEFRLAMQEMIANDTAHGVVVIIDTMKKVVNPMIKRMSSLYQDGAAVSMKGGTMVVLAHVNKNRNSSGKVVYAGTSDIKDDFDCAYDLDTLPDNRLQSKSGVFRKHKKPWWRGQFCSLQLHPGARRVLQ